MVNSADSDATSGTQLTKIYLKKSPKALFGHCCFLLGNEHLQPTGGETHQVVEQDVRGLSRKVPDIQEQFTQHVH